MEDRGHRAIRRRGTGIAITMGGIMTRRAMGNHEIINGRSSRLELQNSNIRVQDGGVMRVRGAAPRIQTMLRARLWMRDMDGPNQRWRTQMFMITDRRKGSTRESIILWTTDFKNSGRLEQGNSSPIRRSQLTMAETTSVEDISSSNSTRMFLYSRCKKSRNIKPRRKATWASKMKIQHVFQAALQITSATI